MVRKYHPDLDLLDSPLISPTPLTSVGGVPGSAIAEKIFNDPDSWDNPLAQDPEATDPRMSWFVEQVEKLKSLSVGADDRNTILSMEQSDLILCTFQDRASQMEVQREAENPSAVSSQEESGKSKAIKNADAIWEARRGRQSLSPLTFSPPSSSEGSDDFSFLHLVSPLATTPPSTKAAPASATWSFLELYGIKPDTPRTAIQTAIVEPKEQQTRGILQGPATSYVPAKPPTSPPKVPLPPVPPVPLKTAPPQADSSKPSSSSVVRRLPAVPPTTEAAEENALLSRASAPALPSREPPSVPHANSARILSEQWASARSSTPSPSGPRTPSVRSPPPAGPRPKGFMPQTRRTSSRSPPRTLASRPPALNL